MINIDAFRSCMSLMPAAVHIITTGMENDRIGVTASSVASFSDSPPSVIVSFAENSASAERLKENDSFCVNMLKAEDDGLADIFAGRTGLRGVDRFQHGSWDHLDTGCPALQNAAMSLDCELLDRQYLAGRLVLIGKIIAHRIDEACDPLVYQGRCYRRLAA
ncbi:flavin reductase family protein [Methylobacterium sp. WL120]|uniref:flavin reductase family protein n=1 Tax=Methylobacterium sp. WL120 TaxID=2603887 RepID=UPI0011C82D0C|nr:flavin reductase family protein [Methylobacterium sp. WL120]TXM69651.1 flavin reductase [Methylobacterium sp. WL120]